VRNDLELTERIKSLVIIAMVSDDELLERLVLKGGNLLDIAYRISTRASVDVDFSVDGDLDSVPNLESRIIRTLTTTFLPEGLTPFDFDIKSVPPNLSEEMKSFWGGYKIALKIIESVKYSELKDDIDRLRKQAIRVGKRGSTKFTIDISNHEYCAGKEARIINGFTVFGYSPPMIVAEKLRAICQQMPSYVKMVKSHPSARARDFVDIRIVDDEFQINFRGTSFREIIEQTFLAKKVPLQLLGQIDRYREYHRGDFRAVEETVKPGVKLDSFDAYFDFVLKKCRDLETLWNV